jgi:hypothetical protein
MEHYLRQGLISSSKVLDIRQVDVTAGKLLDSAASTAEQIPVWVVTFATQEVMTFRNAKTGEIVVGAEDKVEQCHYAAVITRLEEEIEDEVTGGWKVIEVCFPVSSVLSDLRLTCLADGTQISTSISLKHMVLAKVCIERIIWAPLDPRLPLPHIPYSICNFESILMQDCYRC